MSNDNRWRALSQKDKAFFIQQFVRNGINTIDEMERFYNSVGDTDPQPSSPKPEVVNYPKDPYISRGYNRNTAAKLSNIFSSGGPLSNVLPKPFSYSQIPVVRYAEGGPIQDRYEDINKISTAQLFQDITGEAWSNVKKHYDYYDGSAANNLRIRQELLDQDAKRVAEQNAQAQQSQQTTPPPPSYSTAPPSGLASDFPIVPITQQQPATPGSGVVQQPTPPSTDTNVNLEVSNTSPDFKAYTVKSGDTLSKISSSNNIDISKLLELNPQYKNNPNKIRVGDTLNLGPLEISKPTPNPTTNSTTTPPPTKEELKAIREREQSYTSVEAIMNAKHNSNYAIVDKDKQTITVYDASGKQLTVVPINTGASNQDYNTKTYTNKNGKLVNKAGNNSTPAGITEITSIGSYHGAPSFQRARVGNDNKVMSVMDENGNPIPDNIASSLHWERGVGNPNNSNGCVRLDSAGARQLARYLSVGDRLYTLPQQEGSRFVLRDGNLSYVADNTYGKDKRTADTTIVNGKEYSKHDWDDYNVTVNRTYQPLDIEFTPTGKKRYDRNVQAVINSLEQNKESIMEALNLSSAEYNTMAQLTMGVFQQETKFGTSKTFRAKKNAKKLKQEIKKLFGDNSASSDGVAQIKYDADNEDIKKLYKAVGVTDDHNDFANEAKAVVARLCHIYKNQYLGVKEMYDKVGLNTEEALAYLYNNGNSKIIKQLYKDGKTVEGQTKEVLHRFWGRIFGTTKEVPLTDYSDKINRHSGNFRYYIGDADSKALGGPLWQYNSTLPAYEDGVYYSPNLEYFRNPGVMHNNK